MKILLVITGLRMGGAERLVASLADCYCQAGHEVILAYLEGPAIVRPHCREVKLVGLNVDKNPVAIFNAVCRLAKLVRRTKPDVVNTHLFHANILLRVMRPMVGMNRLITTAHNTHIGSRLRVLAYRLSDRWADISSNVSNQAVESYVRQGAVRAGRMIALQNGIDTDEFRFDRCSRLRLRKQLNIGVEETVLLTIGRLTNQKDYPNLFKAAVELERNCKAFRLLIVGDGELRDRLKELAEQLNLSRHVMFLGVRNDVVALISASDFFLMSSAWEGLPMVILEAMACQRLVIATDCGGVVNQVGDAGYVVPPRQSEKLAAAILQAMALSSSERCNYGRRARRRVEEQFSLTATAERYLALYRG